jgi:hypothetical protein
MVGTFSDGMLGSFLFIPFQVSLQDSTPALGAGRGALDRLPNDVLSVGDGRMD